MKAVYDDSGVEKEYTFGTWNTTDVKLRATDPKSTADLTLEVRRRRLAYGGDWAPYTAGADIVTDATGTYIYQFRTILSKGSDTYESVHGRNLCDQGSICGSPRCGHHHQ
ncbi:MAG: hypothetical protein ACLTDX_06210 [[Clostridium] innocuum]